jgi:hypothetical protein
MVKLSLIVQRTPRPLSPFAIVDSNQSTSASPSFLSDVSGCMYPEATRALTIECWSCRFDDRPSNRTSSSTSTSALYSRTAAQNYSPQWRTASSRGPVGPCIVALTERKGTTREGAGSGLEAIWITILPRLPGVRASYEASITVLDYFVFCSTLSFLFIPPSSCSRSILSPLRAPRSLIIPSSRSCLFGAHVITLITTT